MARQQHDAMQIAVEDRVASKLYVYFDLVADKIHSVHRSGGKVMIYCRAGMSRSASLCIAYFMRHQGMNLEDAFNYVKKCRPIIHPNVGFMRQLREYEAKVLARRSRQKLSLIASPSAAGVKRKHSIAMGRGQLVKGEPLPELVYAEEEICDAIDTPPLEEIARRPKPRIQKPKPWKPERLMESYEITTVQVLGKSESDEQEDQVIMQNKRGLSVSQPQTPRVYNKSRRGRHHSQQHNATVGISKENALGVAESRCNTPLIAICNSVYEGSHHSLQREAKGPHPIAPPRRKPFTKISMEPTKIPVSSLTVPLGMCAEFAKGQRLGNLFSRESAISISSPLTGCKGEGVLIAAQESEEIVLECCPVSMPNNIPFQTVINSSNNFTDVSVLKSFNTNKPSRFANNSFRDDSNSNSRLSSFSNSRHSYSQRHHPYSSNNSRLTFSSRIDESEETIPNIKKEVARSVMCQPRTGVAIVYLPQILECSGVYRKQNLPGTRADTATISHCKLAPASAKASNVPSRFVSMSSNQR